MPPSPWLHRFAPRADARLRLVCFPHAGGSASVYFRWARALPAEIELVAVQYPGRAGRSREAMPAGMADLVAGIRDALLPGIDQPYALFGHSMGAAVAYETALALRAAGCPEPRHLFLSGRTPAVPDRAPSPADGDDSDSDSDSDSDEAMLAALRSFAGTPADLLADEEARAVFLPVFRADRRLLETYRPAPAAPLLSCPVTAITGSHDPLTDIPGAARWAALTTGPFGLSVFPGDHFYLTPRSSELTALLTRLLQPRQSATDRPRATTL
jgi:pyochelin biosynthesis protein PchC